MQACSREPGPWIGNTSAHSVTLPRRPSYRSQIFIYKASYRTGCFFYSIRLSDFDCLTIQSLYPHPTIRLLLISLLIYLPVTA